MKVKDITEHSLKRGCNIYLTENPEWSEENPPANIIELMEETKVLRIHETDKNSLKEFFNYELVFGGILPFTNTMFMVIRK